MEAFSKVQTDINYSHSALASENRSSMPSLRTQCPAALLYSDPAERLH